MDQHKLDELDAIIVGAGLAGSLLCDQLLRNGKKVMLYDAGPAQRASAVAAGIIHPAESLVQQTSL
jgi:flavin-dependent dehydrogenase